MQGVSNGVYACICGWPVPMQNCHNLFNPKTVLFACYKFAWLSSSSSSSTALQFKFYSLVSANPSCWVRAKKMLHSNWNDDERIRMGKRIIAEIVAHEQARKKDSIEMCNIYTEHTRETRKREKKQRIRFSVCDGNEAACSNTWACPLSFSYNGCTPPPPPSYTHIRVHKHTRTQRARDFCSLF